ncbi:MAG: hypothetical protein ACT4OZ_17005 [Gemmatimonadota bacterium]
MQGVAREDWIDMRTNNSLTRYDRLTREHIAMDIGLVAAIVMLVIWGIATFMGEAPGWVHALLTIGVFLLILRIVMRGTPAPRPPERR